MKSNCEMHIYVTWMTSHRSAACTVTRYHMMPLVYNVYDASTYWEKCLVNRGDSLSVFLWRWPRVRRVQSWRLLTFDILHPLFNNPNNDICEPRCSSSRPFCLHSYARYRTYPFTLIFGIVHYVRNKKNACINSLAVFSQNFVSFFIPATQKPWNSYNASEITLSKFHSWRPKCLVLRSSKNWWSN